MIFNFELLKKFRENRRKLPQNFYFPVAVFFNHYLTFVEFCGIIIKLYKVWRDEHDLCNV